MGFDARLLALRMAHWACWFPLFAAGVSICRLQPAATCTPVSGIPGFAVGAISAGKSESDPQQTFGPLPGFGKPLGACNLFPCAARCRPQSSGGTGQLSREMGLFAVIAADDSDSDGDMPRGLECSKSEQTLRVTMSDPRTVGDGNRNLFQKRACLGH
jgi:hypothetical protein